MENPSSGYETNLNDKSTISIDARIRAAFTEAACPKTIIDHRYLGFTCVAISLALAVGYLTIRPELYSATSSMLMGNVATASDRLGILSATGDIEDLTFKLFAARVQQLRLESELKGETVLSISPDLTKQASSSEYKSVLDREQQMFAGRMRGFASELANLRQQVDLYRQELDSRSRQIDFASAQQQSIDQDVSSVRTAVAKGIFNGMRLGDIERSAAAVGSRKIEVEAARIALAQSVLTTEQEIKKAESAREWNLLSSLQQSAIDMHAIETQLATARLLQSPTFAQPRDPGSIEDSIAIIQSEATALAVVDTYDLATAAFIHDNPPATFSLSSWLGLNARAEGRSDRDMAAQILQQGLRVTRAGRGSQIDVTFVSNNPEAARLVANGVVSIFSTAESGPAGSTSRPAEIVQRAIPRPSSLSDASIMALGLLFGVALAVLCSLAASVAGIFRRDGRLA